MSSEQHGASQGVSMSRQDLPDGTSVLTMPYDEELAQKAVTNKLPGDEDENTPDPSSSDGDMEDAGPIVRFNDVFTDIGSTYLEALGLDGFETAKAIQKRRDEIFRNEFPLLIPRFTNKCRDCDAEYDTEVDECEQCGSEDIRDPNVEQRRQAIRFFERVNKEGQSLRELYEMCEGDHGRIGVGMHIIKYDYVIARGNETMMGNPLFESGQVIRKEPDELIRADPKRVVPVTDENGRLGGWKWTCPIHREQGLTQQSEYDDGVTNCPVCESELKEVAYVEKEYAKSSTVEKYYFNDEVIDWAHFFPRQHGMDGLSPVHHIWLKQAILHWMDVYAGAFYDPNSDRYPNKFMVVHTTNADAWERNFEKAEDEAEENLYAQQIFTNEYATDSSSTPELQVVDLMDDELLGQDDKIKKRYKSDIRTQFGVTDVFDSELEDAGGLNNEGLQLEVTDRNIASAQRSMASGPLDELMKRLGFLDYKLAFVPSQDKDLDDLEQKIRVGSDAVDSGLEAELSSGELDVKDGEFEEQEDAGGGGGFFGEFDEKSTQTYRFSTEEEARGAAIALGLDGVHQHEGDWMPGADHETFEEEVDTPLAKTAEKLDDAYEHIVWGEVDTKAEPFWESDIPERIINKVREAIDNGAIFDSFESVDENSDVVEFFKDKLSERENWSIGRLTSEFSDQFGVPSSDASTLIRTEMASVLGNARQDVYEDLEETMDEEPVFKWVGPDDHRTTEACEWLKEQTNPDYGGTPRTMSKLIELEKEAHEKFFDLDTFRKHVVHPNERHMFTEVVKLDHPGAAGPVEFEVETVPGGFEVAT